MHFDKKSKANLVGCWPELKQVLVKAKIQSDLEEVRVSANMGWAVELKLKPHSEKRYRDFAALMDTIARQEYNCSVHSDRYDYCFVSMRTIQESEEKDDALAETTGASDGS